MHVTLAGNIMAPSVAFAMLNRHLAARGIQTISLLGCGKEIDLSSNAVRDLVYLADVILIGMSGPEKLAQTELEIAEKALKQDVPFGFYADTYDAFRRPWIPEFLRKRTSFLFTVGEEEKVEAQKLFPDAEIVASGNPTWEYFFSPRFSKYEVRSLFKIQTGEKVILCSLGTALEPNLAMLKNLNGALAAGKNNYSLRTIIIGIHPGDQNYRNDPRIYAKILSPIFRALFVPKDKMPTMDIIPGADYVVDTPGSSIGINAACLRVPVICYCSKEALDSLEESTTKRSWRPCESGVILPVYSPDELSLAFGQDFTAMIERQKEIYPAPQEKGRAVKIMAETIQKYGSGKNG
ncbi:MAG: hypothetical protein HYY55_00175 [Candidatus Niyogibacteria bacterium]|nr:MAG: hypothetical protein HYY55_00175 [Candidatus Niyogibacteria bacterium]